MSTMVVTAPCDPRADVGFLIMAPGDWVPMSGSNTICMVNVLLETGIVPMTEPTTLLRLDTPAGLISATADCADGSCNSVSFDNVPAFAWALDLRVEVPGIGVVTVDIAYGGQWYVVVAEEELGAGVVALENGSDLVRLGKLIKKAVLDTCMPTHPENPEIRGINNTIISKPLERTEQGGYSVKHAVIITRGRLDRSPCGTGSSSRLAIMTAKKIICPGEAVTFRSIIDPSFTGYVKSTLKVGPYDAIVPKIKGRAWITGRKEIFVDPKDPFPAGYSIL